MAPTRLESNGRFRRAAGVPVAKTPRRCPVQTQNAHDLGTGGVRRGYRSAAMAQHRRTLAAVQAAYYLPTAIVPFISRRAFERVTGPKTEWWLVLTVSALVGAVGAALGVAARGEPGPETV